MATSIRGERRYHYRKVREGRAVRSVYGGSGRSAELGAMLDALSAERRAVESEARRAEREAREAEAQAVRSYVGRVERWASLALELAGYHRRKREWRKRRDRDMACLNAVRIETRPDEAHLIPDMDKAQGGDREALGRLRAAISDRTDDLIRLGAGDIAHCVRQIVVGKAAGDDELQRLAMLVKIREVRRQLEGDKPTAIEKMLAERAALLWFLLNWYEGDYAKVGGGEMTLRQDEAHQRRIDRTHRQYLAALRSLAMVRKLASPGPLVSVTRTTTVNATANLTLPNLPESAAGEPEKLSDEFDLFETLQARREEVRAERERRRLAGFRN